MKDAPNLMYVSSTHLLHQHVEDNVEDEEDGPDGPVWLQVSPPERLHETEISCSVPFGRPLTLYRIACVLCDRCELVRMVHHVSGDN